MVTIKSIIGQLHDTSYGGYPYKVVVMVEVPVTEFNKLCPQTGKSRQTMFGRKPASRDLGGLVIEVNNLVHAFNPNIPAWNPSIDSKGHKRASNGIKSMEFVYFFQDHSQAESLGFQITKLKSGECIPKYFQYVEVKRIGA